MPKIKTHSGAKKRFKLSKNGKVIRLLLQIRQTQLRSSVLFLTNNH